MEPPNREHTTSDTIFHDHHSSNYTQKSHFIWFPGRRNLHNFNCFPRWGRLEAVHTLHETTHSTNRLPNTTITHQLMLREMNTISTNPVLHQLTHSMNTLDPNRPPSPRVYYTPGCRDSQATHTYSLLACSCVNSHCLGKSSV